METNIFFKKSNNVLKDGVFAFFIDDKSNDKTREIIDLNINKRKDLIIKVILI